MGVELSPDARSRAPGSRARAGGAHRARARPPVPMMVPLLMVLRGAARADAGS